MNSENKNSVFRNGYPIFDTRYNACVGNNGYVDGRVYASGFAKSVEILIDSALENNDVSVDEIVYPICFGIRHCVEIYIKELISELEGIPSFKNRKLKIDHDSLIKNKELHNLEALWKEFSKKSEAFDDRFKSLNSKVEKYIIDISKIDPNGETFRYATDRENQKHLVKVALINIEYLKLVFKYIKDTFIAIINNSRSISIEYSKGSHTKNLSRNDIYQISKILPVRGLWGNAAFKRSKKKTIKSYQISGREFSDALDIIKKHYEFSYEVGLSNPLRGIVSEDLLCFLEFWWKYQISNKSQDDLVFGSTETYDFLFDDDSDKYKKEYWERIGQEISPEKLSGLSSIYQFGSSYYSFSEDYNEIYQYELRCNLNLSEDELYDGLMHIFIKTNFLNASLKALRSLKYKCLAKKISSQYK